MDDIYLDHFLDAQNVDLEQVLAELSAGKKRSHWIWYIFPQIAPLGYSEKAKYYGIKTLNEAEAFISHPTLSANYLTCLDTLQLHTDQSISNILGGIRSSCTYVGAPSLKQLSKCTTFVRVSNQFNSTFVD